MSLGDGHAVPKKGSSNSLKAKKFSCGVRYPKRGTNSAKLGLSAEDTAWEPWQPRAFLPAYRCEGLPGCPAAQLHTGSWPQTRLVEENQQGQKITSTGIMVPGKGTAGGKESEKLGVGSDILSNYPCDISVLQTTSLKRDNNTLLPVLHHFQSSIPGRRVSAVEAGREISHGSCDFQDLWGNAPSGLTEPWCLPTTIHNPPDTQQSWSPASSKRFLTEESSVP